MNKSFYRSALKECVERGDEQSIYSLCNLSRTIAKIGRRETSKDKSNCKSILDDIKRFLDSDREGGLYLLFGTEPYGKSIHRAFLEWAAENAAD